MKVECVTQQKMVIASMRSYSLLVLCSGKLSLFVMALFLCGALGIHLTLAVWPVEDKENILKIMNKS